MHETSYVRQEADRKARLGLSPETIARRRYGEISRQILLEELEKDIEEGTRMALNGVAMPRLYHEIVKHVMAAGHLSSAAWGIAVSSVARGCLFGKTTLPKPGTHGLEKQDLGKKARLRYCAAYREWQKNHKGTGL